jgi:hypothetical protein
MTDRRLVADLLLFSTGVLLFDEPSLRGGAPPLGTKSIDGP